MTDQIILTKVGQLEKTVEDANDRTLRLGERVEELRDFVQKDVNVRLATVEERSRNILWALGIVIAVVSAIGVQLVLMSSRLGGIEKDVSYLVKSVGELQIKKASEDAGSPESIKQAQDVLADATKRNIKISKEVVAKSGADFIAASPNSPQAWNAALAFLDYKSFLNSSAEIPVKSENLTSASSSTHYDVQTPVGAPHPKFSVAGIVSKTEAAKFNHIGTDFNKDLTIGNAFIVADGGTVVLDDLDLRNEVFRNVHVYYYGKQVILANVYFLNCTFTIVQQANGTGLALAVLNPAPSTTFTAS